MANSEMDAVEIDDAVVGEQRAFSPRFKLLGQALVEATDSAGRGRDSHQFFSHFPNFMGADSTDKHLGQCLSDLWGVPIVAFEDLSAKLSFTIPRNFEILN